MASSAGLWIAWHAKPSLNLKLAIAGSLHGEWWKLLSHQLMYGNGVYAFATLVAISLFGWLLEARHGPAVVLALFFGAGAAGALLAEAIYPAPVLSGGAAGALALLAAWAAPDLRALRTGAHYEGDLLGAGAFAALLLALPFAIEPFGAIGYQLIVAGTSWVSGVLGALIGLLVGLGLGGLDEGRG